MPMSEPPIATRDFPNISSHPIILQIHLFVTSHFTTLYENIDANTRPHQERNPAHIELRIVTKV